MKHKLSFSFVIALSSVSFAGGFASMVKAIKQGKSAEVAFAENSQYLKNTFKSEPGRMAYRVQTSKRFGDDVFASMESVGRGGKAEFNLVANKNLYSTEFKASENYRIVNVKTMEDIKKVDGVVIDSRTVVWDEALVPAKAGDQTIAGLQTVSKEVQFVKGADSKVEAFIPAVKIQKEHISVLTQQRKVLDKDGIESAGFEIVKNDRDRQTMRLTVSFNDIFPKGKIPDVREVRVRSVDTASSEFSVVTKDANGSFSNYNYKLAPDNKTWIQKSKDVLGKDYMAVHSASEPTVIKAGGSVFKPQPPAGATGVTN